MIAEVANNTLYLNAAILETFVRLNDNNLGIYLVFLKAVIEGHELFHLQGSDEETARRQTIAYLRLHPELFEAVLAVIRNQARYGVQIDPSFAQMPAFEELVSNSHEAGFERRLNDLSSDELSSAMTEAFHAGRVAPQSLFSEWDSKRRTSSMAQIAGVIVLRKIKGQWAVLMGQRNDSDRDKKRARYAFPGGRVETATKRSGFNIPELHASFKSKGVAVESDLDQFGRNEYIPLAARREGHEETGLQLFTKNFAGRLNQMITHRGTFLVHYFIYVDDDATDEVPGGNGEMINFVWVPAGLFFDQVSATDRLRNFFADRQIAVDIAPGINDTKVADVFGGFLMNVLGENPQGTPDAPASRDQEVAVEDNGAEPAQNTTKVESRIKRQSYASLKPYFKGRRVAERLISTLDKTHYGRMARALQNKAAFIWKYNNYGVDEIEVVFGPDGFSGFVQVSKQIRNLGMIGEWSLIKHSWTNDFAKYLLYAFDGIEGLEKVRGAVEMISRRNADSAGIEEKKETTRFILGLTDVLYDEIFGDTNRAMRGTLTQGRQLANRLLSSMDKKEREAVRRALDINSNATAFRWIYKNYGHDQVNVLTSQAGFSGFAQATKQIRQLGVVGEWSLSQHTWSNDIAQYLLHVFDGVKGLEKIRQVITFNRQVV